MTTIKRQQTPWRTPIDGQGVLAPSRYEPEADTDGSRKRCPRCQQWRAFGQPCERCEVQR